MPPDVLLMRFRQGWNEDQWQPKSGRLTGYMQPWNDAGWKIAYADFERPGRWWQSTVPALVNALEIGRCADSDAGGGDAGVSGSSRSDRQIEAGL